MYMNACMNMPYEILRITTDYSAQPWDTLTYVRTRPLERVKLWKCCSCGAGFCLGSSRAGAFHRELLSQCFPCACVCVFWCAHACMRACVCTCNQPLPSPSFPICPSTSVQWKCRSRAAWKTRSGILSYFQAASRQIYWFTVLCFVFPPSRISLRVHGAVGSQFTYCALPALSPPGGRKPQWKLEPCVAVYSDWQETQAHIKCSCGAWHDLICARRTSLMKPSLRRGHPASYHRQEQQTVKRRMLLGGYDS